MKKLLVIAMLANIGLSACLPIGTANAQTGYITNWNDNTVSVINVATNTVTATIPVGTSPYGVSVSPDGSTVYVTNCGSNNVSVINTATNTVTATIPVAYPNCVAVSPDGSTAYVTTWNSSINTLSLINTATNAVTTTINIGYDPVGICVTPDGSTVYIANDSDGHGNTVSVISTATNTITATIKVGSCPNFISVSPDGSTLYVSNQFSNTVSVISTATNTVTATINVGTSPYCISMSPDGSKIYVTNYGANSVSVINSMTNTVSATIPVGNNPYGISMSLNGNLIYVPNSGSNTVSVINSGTNTVTATIPVGNSPRAYGNFISTYTQPTTCQANFVYNTNADTVSFINNSGTNMNTWLWTFGEGDSSKLKNPVHTYSGSGTYNVCLTASDTLSGNVVCSNTYCTTITITQNNCTLQATAQVVQPAIINGNDGDIYVTVTGGVPPYSYTWNTGDTTQNLINVAAGIYTVLVSDNHASCTPVYLTTILYQPYDTAGGSIVDTLLTNAIDTCFSFTVDSFYISQVVVNLNMVAVTWVFVGNSGQSTTLTVDYTYSYYGNNAVVVTLSCNKGMVSYMSFIHINKATGIEEYITALQMLIYPVPANNSLTVENIPPHAVIQILNIQGQLIKTLVANDGKTNIDISNLARGVYIVEAKTENVIEVKKFVKE
jgi:YVTN family beta-propeller protein